MTPTRFHVTYSFAIHSDGVTEAEARALTSGDRGRDVGACDAFVFLSIMLTDETWEQTTLAYNGKEDRSLPPEEIWRAWTILAGELANAERLPSHKRGLCSLIDEAVKAIKRRKPKKN